MDDKKKEHQLKARKPFRKPHLRVYGHISAITQTTPNSPLQRDLGTPVGDEDGSLAK